MPEYMDDISFCRPLADAAKKNTPWLFGFTQEKTHDTVRKLSTIKTWLPKSETSPGARARADLVYVPVKAKTL